MLKDLKLTLDLYQYIVPRIIDISLGGDNWFSIDLDDSLPDYDRFILNENLGKPSLGRIENEFQEYKNELIRKKNLELKETWGQMKDPRMAFNELGELPVNTDMVLKEILENEDEPYLNSIVSAYSIAKEKQNKKDARRKKKDIGRKVRGMCESAMDVIIGYNVTRELTKQQQNAMKQAFKDIMDYLESYQPKAALELVELVTVDGVLVTQEMKDDVIEELS